ncbi:guanine nucleotide-binding protein subunit beta-like protein 1 [Topomyia yanbarensis]|uniref:guanine nucleotide-binding protein subunit beta-like protein 1 n=1 Tax=Topomyia yanbarensis TaxID=2498891 RepID=UPI00273ABCF8|nr:guanine nucleotide-binding protein subunit beta-like protein 1 [Topomyia yanbarensis]
MALLPPDPVYCLKSPDLSAFHSLCFHTSERLHAGTTKGTVQLWDLQSNRTNYQLSVGTSPIINITHTEDALITQEKEGYVKLWELTNSAYVLRHEVSTNHVGFCRFVYLGTPQRSPANTPTSVIIPKGGSSISILCGRTFCERQKLTAGDKAHQSRLPPLGTVMCFKPIELQGGSYLLAGYESGTIILWDLNTSKPISHIQLDGEECLMDLDYDPVTNRGICGGSSDKITVFSLDRKTLELCRKSEIAIKNAGVHRVRIRKDLKVFASAGWDGRVRIFSWKSLRPLAVLTEHKGELMDIVYSDEKVSMWKAVIMAAAGSDGQISLWDLYN